MFVDNYEIQIASPSDREYLVAEIYHKQLFVEINQEYGYLEIQLYPNTKNAVRLDLAKFIKVLNIAKTYLQARNINVIPLNKLTIKKNNGKTHFFNDNKEFAFISDGLIEIYANKKELLKFPLENFLEKLKNV